MEWLRILVLCVGAVQAAGCGLGNVAHMPGDLARSLFDDGPFASEPEQPGAVGLALFESAAAKGSLWLIADTENRADDPKHHAARCDDGDLEACSRVAGILVYHLDRAELGLSLWLRACEAGVARACVRAAQAYAQPFAPYRDAALALDAWARACEAPEPDRRSCFHAARALVDHPSKPPRRSDLYYERLDRACELGEFRSCGLLWTAFDSADPPLPADPLLADYYEKLSRIVYRPMSEDKFRLQRERSHAAEPEAWAVLGGAQVRKAEVGRTLAAAAFGDRVMTAIGPAWIAHWNRESRRLYKEALGRCASGPDPQRCIAFQRMGGGSLSLGGSAAPALRGERRGPPTLPDRVSPVCSDCLSRCDATTPGGSVCLCRCLREQGGCGVEPLALELCSEAPVVTSRAAR